MKMPFDCLTCPAYVAHDLKRPASGGVCHGAPPTASVIGTRLHPLTQKPEAVTASYYATVGPGDWCSFHPMFAMWVRGQSGPDPLLPGELKPDGAGGGLAS